MTPAGEDDDKVVIDAVDLAAIGRGRSAAPAERPPERTTAPGAAARDLLAAGLARGTRDVVVVPRGPAGPRTQGPGDAAQPARTGASPQAARAGHARDPAEVLRMWPSSRSAAAMPPAASSHPDDKLAFAHLARDLYRELGELEAAHDAAAAQRQASSLSGPPGAAQVWSAVTTVPGGSAASAPGSAHSVPPHVAPCANLACHARLTALRGGLIEACLLVQRMVTTPATRAEIEGQVRHLLELLER